MKRISADYIFPGNKPPIKNGVVVVNSLGEIETILDPAIDTINWQEIERHKGIICPGFVNAHCHLELSYLKGKIEEKTQLHGFVEKLMVIRDTVTEQERWFAIQLAEQEMIAGGIVAVGDISNGNTSFHLKSKKHLKYHTFIEVFGLEEDQAIHIVKKAQSLKSIYPRATRVTITPHAPYSMSKRLVELVNEESNNFITIHNQETSGENELFQSKSGKMYEQLTKFSHAIKSWEPTGKNSLPSYLPALMNGKKVLLVHNTYTSKEDVVFARRYIDQIYWCFCPNANMYIEAKQPDYSLFTNEKCTIGTDSLASNWSLSILEELKTITKKNPAIELQTLLKWATYNGAEFLEFEELGSIEKGKTPGLNLIENIDLNNLSLTKKSAIKPLLKLQQ